MNRAAALLVVLVLALAACAPAVSVGLDPVGDGTVVATAEAASALYGANLALVNAATDDARCVSFGLDAGCVLGDLEAGELATVVVRLSPAAPPDAVIGCQLFGFLRPERDVGSYRFFPCRASPR